MKLFLKNLLLLTCAAVLTAACSSDDSNFNDQNDMIWDISPFIISVKVLSPNGNSILTAANTRSVTATYDGVTYPCLESTRFDAPEFWGLKFLGDYLLFGELDGAATYENKQLILNWGASGEADTITFSHRVKWEDGVPSFQKSFSLNGEPVKDEIVLYKELTEETYEVDVNTPRINMPLSAEQKQMVQNVNDFGFRLFNLMQAEVEDPYGSCVTSPLSVAYVLGMLATGARVDFGESDGTRAEILRALGLQAAWQYDYLDPMNDLFKALISYTPLVDNTIDIQLANAFFAHKDFSIYASYPILLANYYNADYKLLDFTSADAVKEINGWCNQKTKGLIPEIISKIPEEAVAFLLNAIYFKGGWTYPFLSENTSEQTFTRTDGTTTKVPMMNGMPTLDYARAEQFETIKLPFGKMAYEMQILLPAEGVTVTDLTTSLNSSTLNALEWTAADVTLSLPRFSIETDLNKLKQQLQDLGIKRMFSSDAQFTEISPVSNFCISDVIQKARIKVDEEGCEAAAVTAAFAKNSIDLSPLQITFRADRPFLYLIREQSSGTIFFIGTYGGE